MPTAREIETMTKTRMRSGPRFIWQGKVQSGFLVCTAIPIEEQEHKTLFPSHFQKDEPEVLLNHRVSTLSHRWPGPCAAPTSCERCMWASWYVVLLPVLPKYLDIWRENIDVDLKTQSATYTPVLDERKKTLRVPGHNGVSAPHRVMATLTRHHFIPGSISD
jgi:hypothetical protein